MTARPATPIRLAIANDFPVVVAGLTVMLAPYRARISVREVTLGQAHDTDVDLVLIDTFGAPRADPDVLTRLLAAGRAKVVLFSWQAPQLVVSQMMDRGAAGYLGKDLDAARIVRALEAIHAGRSIVSTGAVGSAEHDDGRGWPGRELGLSAREAEVVALIAQGMSNVEIASLCFLSVTSIKTYIRTAYRKMGVRTRTQAVLWALRNNMVPGTATDPQRAGWVLPPP